MSSRVRAMISLGGRGKDEEPRPWDGMLVEERTVIESVDLLRNNKLIGRLCDDGTFFVANKAGVLQPSTDLAALGRVFYMAMLGKEPPR